MFLIWHGTHEAIPNSCILSIQAFMMSDLKNITTFLEGYKVVCNDLGINNVEDCLKRHYADVCSAGDTLMHIILKHLIGEATPESLLAIAKEWEDEDLFWAVIDNLVDTLDDWYSRGECKPNVWWAS